MPLGGLACVFACRLPPPIPNSLFLATGIEWLHFRGAARWRIASSECYASEKKCCAYKRYRVMRRYTVQKSREDRRQKRQTEHQSHGDANKRQLHALVHDELEYISSLGAERHTNANVKSLLSDGILHYAVD